MLYIQLFDNDQSLKKMLNAYIRFNLNNQTVMKYIYS